jgi:hypothetical protein
MSFIQVKNAGQIGVIETYRCTSSRWVRGLMRRISAFWMATHQFLGHGAVYGAPLAVQHVLPVTAANVRSWIYATASKQYIVQNVAGAPVHTDITHARRAQAW